MLNDTSRFKERWHESKVTSDVDQRAILKEAVRICPEVLGILILEVYHLLGTELPVLLSRV